MADIVNPDGTDTPVPDSSLESVLRSGKFKPRSSMTTVGPDGDAYDVPPEHITEYLNAGHHLVPRAKAQHMANVKEAGEHPLEAFGVGAASGIFPGANAALAAVGGPSLERQGELHEGNPVAFPLGQGAGNVAQAIGVGALTGGLGEGAELGRLGTLGVQAAKDAALFGAQGAQNEINEQSLGDHHFNGEAVAEQAGLGAILGGLTAPVLGLAREFIPSPISAAGKAVSKLSDSLGRLTGVIAGKAAGDADQAAISAVGGRIMRGAGAGVPRAAEAVRNDAYTDLAKTTNDVMDESYTSSKYMDDSLRPAAAATQVSAHPYETVKSGVEDYIAKHVAPVEESLLKARDYDKNVKILEAAKAKWAGSPPAVFDAIASKIGDLGPKLNQDMVDKGLQAISDLRASAGSATDGDAYHEALRNFRKGLDKIQKYSDPVGNTGAKEAILKTKSLLEQMATPARAALVNPGIFGPGAEVNKLYNGITKGKIDAVKDLIDTFGAKELHSDAETIIPRYRVSAVDLERVIGHPSKLTSQKGLRVLENFKNTMAELNKAEKKMAGMAHASLTTDDMQDLLGQLAKKQSEAQASSVLAKRGDLAGGNFKPLLAGAAAHAITGGMVPGAREAGYALAKGFQIANHPASALEALGKIKYLADQHTAKIAKGAADFMVKTGRVAGPILGRDVLDSSHFKAGADRDSKSQETLYDKRVGEIRNLASNPQLLQNTLMEKTSGMADAAPMTTLATHQAAIASIKAIEAAIPQPPQQHAVQEPYRPDPEEMRTFESTYAVATTPVRAINGSIIEGTVTPGMIALGDAIRPQTMNEIRRAYSNQMASHPDYAYSLKQQFSLSMLFKVPISVATDPQQIMFQQAMVAPQQPNNPQQGSKPRVSGLAKLDMAEQTMLPGEARQMDMRTI